MILENPDFKRGSARAKWFTAIKRYDEKEPEASMTAIVAIAPVRKSGEVEAPVSNSQ